MPRYNLFTKIVILLLIMLIPIVGLYFFSNETSSNVLETELNQSNINQLTFFQNQVNTNIDLLALWPNLLIQDPDISNFRDIFTYQPYLDLDTITLVKRIQTKIRIQESSSNWRSQLYIYSPTLERVVSVNDVRKYDVEQLNQVVAQGWHVTKTDEPGREFLFSWFTVSPYDTLRRPGGANGATVLIEVRFDSGNIADMLDSFKSDGRRDPVYYKKNTGVIYNRTADRTLTDKLIAKLEREPLQAKENRTVALDDEHYLVNIVLSNTTGWYLIDYMPLSDVMKPIQSSSRLFYFSVACLLLMSTLAAYLFYAQVQVPIRKLVTGFQRLKNGDYAIRVTPKGNSEFSFVFTRFNSMVEQIQELFEKVYLEKIHVREAKLKQLQSQINPHFFYNCFSYISSMAKLKNYQAVVAMAENLSKYYRYTTRQERDIVPLSEELDFVGSYLEIQKMRMNRLQCSIELPNRMKGLELPPLTLQPLVENAVLHGIESHADSAFIRIVGEWEGAVARLVVEDNGKGMTEAEQSVLLAKLRLPMDEKMGCGLWNVHQRFLLRYGEGAGIAFEASELGGLKVVLEWRVAPESNKEATRHD
ncbi:histidine kinase [Paenibacillus sp. TRM 82003]|nr:histidine kinase [Paenibacillus sp. TRM 82003]